MNEFTAKPSFEYVSQLVMLEEQSPTYEALCRWQKRFPDYHDLLADYFARWATRVLRPQRAAVIDEDVLVRKGVSSKEPLPLFDQLVLAAVFVLCGTGYIVNINQKVREVYGRDVPLASTLGSLLRLEQRRLVEWRYADPEKEPEKEGTQYFAVTSIGERVLVQVKATSSLIADFVP